MISIPAAAQAQPTIAAQGYITAVHSTSSFEINRKRVSLSANTCYAFIGKEGCGRISRTGLVRVGSYVQIAGSTDRHTQTLSADFLYLRDDLSRRLSGFTVIDKLLSPGSEPVFRADGYRMRLTSATHVSFNGDIKSITDIATNTWLHYEGKRDNSGTLILSQITFLPTKSAKPNHDPDDEPEELRYTAIDDASLQQRVQRIGMSVIPAYQKALPDNDPSKIHFQFVAIDNRKYRSEICAKEGLILLPKQVLERLRNDDQLAAVLADGVAFHLQRQGARLEGEGQLFNGIKTGGYLFLPVVGLPAIIGGHAAEQKMLYAMEEQRGRVALLLLSEANYDPWQAPEAWRLLAPKQLPTDRNTIDYPENSGYLLNILALQYPKESVSANAMAELQ